MNYNNLLYFLVVIFIISTNMAATEPWLPPLWAGIAFSAAAYLFSRTSRRLFARAHNAPQYIAAEKRLGILAVLVFACFVYGLDLKHYLMPLSFDRQLPVLTNIAGLSIFFLLLSLVWKNALPRYQQIFQSNCKLPNFLWTNLRVSLPLILPWLALSLLSNLLNLLPFPWLLAFLHPPWGDALLFICFLFFLAVLFPPLVRLLWGCKPMPPGPLRDRLTAFCQSQGFYSPILIWPLFEGQVITAAVMGLIPQIRYLLVTPALLEILSEEELDSVLAHEIGHVKHGHLLLYLALILGFSLLAGAMTQPLPLLILSSPLFYEALPFLPLTPDSFLTLLTTLPFLLALLLYFRFLFGYFIRHFERQADAAVFSALDTGRFLVSAFDKIAHLGGTKRDEKSWHHFGIGERITFLQRCEADRGQITRHRLFLRSCLIVYLVCVALGLWSISQLDLQAIAKGKEVHYTEAVLAYKVRQDPDNSQLLLTFAQFLQGKQMERKAIAAYDQALQLEPMNPRINNALAWLLLTVQDRSLRDPKRALILAKTAVTLQESGPILDTLATAYWANDQAEQALVTEFKALTLDPRNQRFYQRQIKKFTEERWDGTPR